jgi:nitrate/TMAO reductase-like tetraheme cytochrome c subunit
MTPRRAQRVRRWLMLAGVAGVVSAPTGWWVTDRLEQRNDFCNACHLPNGEPLHLENRRDFDALPAASLAAAHGAAGVDGRSDPAFRCIDCHGGTGALGRARVKLLSARDAFWYVVGRFEEPEGMHWPLLDADCRRCHESFGESRSAAWGDPFHELAVHNHNLGMSCVTCHLTHEPGRAELDFLEPAHVRGRCAQCHPEFEEGME